MEWYDPFQAKKAKQKAFCLYFAANWTDALKVYLLARREERSIEEPSSPHMMTLIVICVSAPKTLKMEYTNWCFVTIVNYEVNIAISPHMPILFHFEKYLLQTKLR